MYRNCQQTYLELELSVADQAYQRINKTRLTSYTKLLFNSKIIPYELQQYCHKAFLAIKDALISVCVSKFKPISLLFISFEENCCVTSFVSPAQT